MQSRACRTSWVFTVLFGVAFGLELRSVQAYTEDQPRIQLAARNREASIMTQFSCNSAGENRRIYFLFQYTNRRPESALYRVIYQDWGRSIGRRDWSDRNLAVEVIARGCRSR